MHRLRWSRLCLIGLVWCAVGALFLHGAAAQGVDAPAAPSGQVTVAPAATPAPVWVNIPSHIYHFPGSRWYGRTGSGKYVSEADAIAEGDRAAMNEHRPRSYGELVARDVEAASALPSPRSASTALLPSPVRPMPLLPEPAAERLAPAPSPQRHRSRPFYFHAAGRAGVYLPDGHRRAERSGKAGNAGRARSQPKAQADHVLLAQARAGGADPGELIDQAQGINDSTGTPRAPLVKASLLRNLKICDGLGLLTLENLWRLRHGNAPVVTRGPYVGQNAEVDHIVPRSVSLETDNELANLEMLPAALNRAKAAKVGDRQLALARKFREAGMITDATMARIEARYRPAGTEKYELQEP